MTPKLGGGAVVGIRRGGKGAEEEEEGEAQRVTKRQIEKIFLGNIDG